jgi:SAM-dependent methyltransferase
MTATRRPADGDSPAWALSERVVPDGRVWVDPEVVDDEATESDRAYHDAEASIYDSYLVQEPVRSVEAWLVPTIVGLTSGLVVDVGCGTGRVTEALAAAGRSVIAVDHSHEMLRITARKVAAERAVIVRADVRRLPIIDGACDAVVCSGVLHHIPNWEQVLHEAARVLRPGGVLVVREPNAGYADWAFGPIERLLARLAGGGRAKEPSSAHREAQAAQPLHERPLSRSALCAAAPPVLRWRWVATAMLLGCLDVPDGMRGRRSYLRLANAIDRWLLRAHWRAGGALLHGVADRGSDCHHSGANWESARPGRGLRRGV